MTAKNAAKLRVIEAVPLYRAVMLEIERVRVARGWPMDKFSELAGMSDRSYAKYLHVDSRTGKMASWPTLDSAVATLFPNGYDVVIRPRDGMKHGAESLKARLLQVKATVHPKTQRALMSEIGKKGGEARAQNPNRKALARRAAKARWRTPKIVEITPVCAGSRPPCTAR